MKSIAMLRVFSGIFAVMALFACTPSGEENYIESFSETVSSKDPVSLVLSDEAPVLLDNLDESILASAISIKPSQGFIAGITGEKTLVIKPVGAWKPGTQYSFRLNFKAISKEEVPNKCDFSVNVPSPRFSFSSRLLSVADNPDLCRAEVMITTTDIVSAEIIEKGFKVKPDDYSLVWDHSDDGLEHRVTINGIKKTDKTQSVAVKANYSNVEPETSWFNQEFFIPASNDFSFLFSQTGYKSVDLFFSQSIASAKDIDRFIKIYPQTEFSTIVKLNVLSIYLPSDASGEYTIEIDPGFSSASGETLEKPITESIKLEAPEPYIELMDQRSILPTTQNMTVAFRSRMYSRARIRVRRIFESNILQFLQDNNIDGWYNLERTASTVADTIVVLSDFKDPKLQRTCVYGIQLQELAKARTGDIYRVEICGLEPIIGEEEEFYSYWFGSWKTYEQRSANVLCSDLGMIVKGSEEEYEVFVRNIVSTEAVKSAKVKLYDDVNQIIVEGITDANGRIGLKASRPAAVAIAEYGTDKMYLRLANGNALSTSDFDVSGQSVSNNIKAYVFGERGVWRPGDSIHLSVIARFADSPLPESYPIKVSLTDPAGRITQTLTRSRGSDGLYYFPLATASDAPTGRWEARVSVGPEVFTKTIKVETVKPNRLKMDLKMDDMECADIHNFKGSIDVAWLHGTPGKNLRTTLDLNLLKGNTQFDKYPGYCFQDPTRPFESRRFQLVDKTTDSDGTVTFDCDLDLNASNLPGMIRGAIDIKAFEQSGDFSTTATEIGLSPFPTYIGIKIDQKESQWGESYVPIDQGMQLNLVSLSADGENKNARIRLDVYKIDWRWWWESESEGLASYTYESTNKPVISELHTLNGELSILSKPKGLEYGMYLVRAVDLDGGHAASGVYYFADGNSSYVNDSADGFVRLNTKLDKDNYKTGETARLTVPSAKGAKLLVSVEKNQKVLRSFWVNAHEGQTEISIKLDKEMVPNVYVSVTMIQPHNRSQNDAPIRMYGVQNINVEDSDSRIIPVIDLPDSVEPERSFKVKVGEKSGKPMTYMLQIVDEGLLGLTSFKTPDPWKQFFAKEALGIRTWDVYNMIVGAYGGKIEQLFAIGGDGEETGRLTPQKANRFSPVSICLGPFTLKADRVAEHDVRLPSYIGEVRVSVVAVSGMAAGSSSAKLKVKKDLMLQSTMPRNMGCGEIVEVPVTVFCMGKDMKNVEVEIVGNEFFAIEGPAKQSIKTNGEGEYMVYFRGRTPMREGIGSVNVKAVCGAQKAEEYLQWDVIHPNVRASYVENLILEEGGRESLEIEWPGMDSSHSPLIVTASSLPEMNFVYRLNSLTAYPHECVEQMTSRVFPLLYISKLIRIGEDQKLQYQTSIEKALERYASYQQASGGMSLWPGRDSDTDNWASVYAAHFMVEAQNCGYYVPEQVKEKALSFVKDIASDRTPAASIKAYALWVMALNGKPGISLMNNLRDDIENQSRLAANLLAAAYAASGQKSTAESLMKTATGLKEEDNWQSYSNPTRNRAVELSVLVQMGEDEKAFEMIQGIASDMKDKSLWMSTQTLAWTLSAVGRYASNFSLDGCKMEVENNGSNYNLENSGAMAVLSIAVNDEAKQKSLGLENKGKGRLHCSVSTTGIPTAGEEKAYEHSLSIQTKFYDASGKEINPDKLALGTEMSIVTKIVNNSGRNLRDLALTQRMASGWEIHNPRLSQAGYAYPRGVKYQDFRDDRVLSYFDLVAHQSRSLTINVTATYSGEFYLPAFVCEGMYDNTNGAGTAGRRVVVKR